MATLCTSLLAGRWLDIILSCNLGHLLNNHEIAQLKRHTTKLASEPQLRAIAANASEILILLKSHGYIPEINKHGKRLCVHVSKKRCTKYDVLPLCKQHWKESMFGNVFKNQQLRDLYHQLHTSPSRGQLDAEQAVMRMMLAQMLERLDTTKGIPLDFIAQVTVMCEKISGVTEKMAKLNVITPEQVDRLLEQITTIFVKYVPEESLDGALEEIKALKIGGKIANIEYEPGDRVGDVTITAEVTPNLTVQKAALVQLAKDLSDELE